MKLVRPPTERRLSSGQGYFRLVVGCQTLESLVLAALDGADHVTARDGTENEPTRCQRMVPDPWPSHNLLGGL